MVREVMDSGHRTFIYNLPLPSEEDVYVHYPLEHEAGALAAAHERVQEIMAMPRNPLPDAVQKQIMDEVPGILPETLKV